MKTRSILFLFIFCSALLLSQAQDTLRESTLAGITINLKKESVGKKIRKNSNTIRVGSSLKSFCALTRFQTSGKTNLRQYNFYITSNDKQNSFPLSFVLLNTELQRVFETPVKYKKGYNSLLLPASILLPPGTYYFGLRYELDDENSKKKFSYTVTQKNIAGKEIAVEYTGPTMGIFPTKNNTDDFALSDKTLIPLKNFQITHNLEIVIKN